MTQLLENAADLHPVAARAKLCIAAATGFILAALWLLPRPPFSAFFTSLAALYGAVHLAAWLGFGRLAARPWILRRLPLFNMVLLGAVISDTGGVSSPFVFAFFWLLVTGAVNLTSGAWTPALAAACYLAGASVDLPALLGVEASVTGRAAFRGPLAEAAVAALSAVYILLTGYGARWMLARLRERQEQDGQEKAKLLKRFSELDSTAQIGLLAHRIAHDLRGPVASVSGYLEMELADAETPERRENIRSVSKAVDGIVESLRGITSFGRPGGLSPEEIDLANFMRDLVAIISFSPQARWVKFDLRPPEKGVVVVNASRADLQQAFFNIIKNSIEAVAANPDGKAVEIRVENDGRDARISVSDNGPGMSEELLRTVFRRSATTKKDGTGVGLMITRDLLLRNGGDVKLRNREAGGLTAVVSLPAAETRRGGSPAV